MGFFYLIEMHSLDLHHSRASGIGQVSLLSRNILKISDNR